MGPTCEGIADQSYVKASLISYNQRTCTRSCSTSVPGSSANLNTVTYATRLNGAHNTHCRGSDGSSCGINTSVITGVSRNTRNTSCTRANHACSSACINNKCSCVSISAPRTTIHTGITLVDAVVMLILLLTVTTRLKVKGEGDFTTQTDYDAYPGDVSSVSSCGEQSLTLQCASPNQAVVITAATYTRVSACAEVTHAYAPTTIQPNTTTGVTSSRQSDDCPIADVVGHVSRACTGERGGCVVDLSPSFAHIRHLHSQCDVYPYLNVTYTCVQNTSIVPLCNSLPTIELSHSTDEPVYIYPSSLSSSSPPPSSPPSCSLDLITVEEGLHIDVQIIWTRAVAAPTVTNDTLNTHWPSCDANLTIISIFSQHNEENIISLCDGTPDTHDQQLDIPLSSAVTVTFAYSSDVLPDSPSLLPSFLVQYSVSGCATSQLPAIQHADLVTFSAATSAQFQCQPGYIFTNDSVQTPAIGASAPGVVRVTCAGNIWISSGRCIGISCSRLSAIPGGVVSVDGSTYPNGTATYRCNPNFRLDGDALRACLIDGTWSGTEPQCRTITCLHPGIPTNGAASPSIITQYSVSTSIRFSCHVGYELRGSDTITCGGSTGLGEWTNPRPNCTIIDCGHLSTESLSDGVVHDYLNSTTTYGSVVQLRCAAGYTLNITSSTAAPAASYSGLYVCSDDERWHGHHLTCIYDITYGDSTALPTTIIDTTAATTSLPTTEPTTTPTTAATTDVPAPITNSTSQQVMDPSTAAPAIMSTAGESTAAGGGGEVGRGTTSVYDDTTPTTAVMTSSTAPPGATDAAVHASGPNGLDTRAVTILVAVGVTVILLLVALISCIVWRRGKRHYDSSETAGLSMPQNGRIRKLQNGVVLPANTSSTSRMSAMQNGDATLHNGDATTWDRHGEGEAKRNGTKHNGAGVVLRNGDVPQGHQARNFSSFELPASMDHLDTNSNACEHGPYIILDMNTDVNVKENPMFVSQKTIDVSTPSLINCSRL